MIYTTDTVLSWLEELGYPDWVRTQCVERSLVSALVDRKPGARNKLLREANRMWDEWRTEVFEADLSEAKGDKGLRSRCACFERQIKGVKKLIRDLEKHPIPLSPFDAARQIRAAMKGDGEK